MQNASVLMPGTGAAPLPVTPRDKPVDAKVKETHSHYLVSLKVPHVKKEDLKIELKHHKQLLVRGCFGNYFQSVTFACAIQSDNVRATLVDGVLQLLLPKATSSMSFH